MRYIFICLIIFLPTLLLAQVKTKKVKNKVTGEEYYVLASDISVKQGNYKVFKNNKLVEEGTYENNSRQGHWITYSNGKIIKEGNYKDDKKIGEWNFYDYYEKLEQTYDYSIQKLVFNNSVKHVSNTKPNTEYDAAPILIGGWLQVSKILQDNIRYPQKAKDKNTQGKVYIEITINEMGKTTDIKIKRGIGDGCDEEALRVVKLIPDEWVPAIKDGKAVASTYVLPIEYKLN